MISCLIYYYRPFVIVVVLTILFRDVSFFFMSFLHWTEGQLYLWKAPFSKVGRWHVIYIYICIHMAVIVSVNFIEGKNHTKPTHRWLLLYPIIRVFTPQELYSRTSSASYPEWIHHSVLLRGRVIDAICERYDEYMGISSNGFRWCSNFQVLERIRRCRLWFFQVKINALRKSSQQKKELN